MNRPTLLKSEGVYWERLTELIIHACPVNLHSLQYPVDIKFKDGTIKTINNEEEMKIAYDYCWEKDDDDKSDDDKDGKLNKAIKGRNRIRDRIRTILERFPRLRERLSRE